MRIAYLIGQYPAINHGYLLEEIRVLRRSGIQVAVASVSLPDRPPELLNEAEREERQTTHYIKTTPFAAIAWSIVKAAVHSPRALLRGLRCALRMSRGTWRGVSRHLLYFVEAVLLVDWMAGEGVTHVHVSFCGSVGAIATHIAPITMSLGVYGFGEVFDPVGTSLATRIEASDFVRSVSRHLCSLLMITCPPSQWPKLEYVPLGIDAQAFLPAPLEPEAAPFRLVSVGRLAPEKGQRLLIEAAERLHKRGADFVLHLVGGGPDHGPLEREIAAKGLAGLVTLEGEVDQDKLLAIYRNSSAFVMASLYEGVPMVLMEAMSMEIPCIAPRITGIPELIHDGVDGLLFTPADVEELTACIWRLIESPALRQSLARQARESIIRDRSRDLNAERFAALLRKRLVP